MNAESNPADQGGQPDQLDFLSLRLALSLVQLRDAMVNLSLFLKDHRGELEHADQLQTTVVQLSEELIGRAKRQPSNLA